MEQLRDWLFIGNYHDLKLIKNRGTNDIDSILNLAEPVEITQKKTLYLNVEDGVPIKEEDAIIGTEFLLDQYYLEHKILVACGAGISRSATFCVLIIKEIEKLSLLEAYKSIKSKYVKAMPHPALWKSVCEFYNEPFDYVSLLKS